MSKWRRNVVVWPPRSKTPFYVTYPNGAFVRLEGRTDAPFSAYSPPPFPSNGTPHQRAGRFLSISSFTLEWNVTSTRLTLPADFIIKLSVSAGLRPHIIPAFHRRRSGIPPRHKNAPFSAGFPGLPSKTLALTHRLIRPLEYGPARRISV